MRSAISGFAGGWAGIGLLLMRLACGGALLGEAVRQVVSGPPAESLAYIAFMALAGLAILTGYCARIAGAGAAALELWALKFADGDALTHSLLATLATALGMIGPGAWSVDARLSGWRRIHIPRRGD